MKGSPALEEMKAKNMFLFSFSYIYKYSGMDSTVQAEKVETVEPLESMSPAQSSQAATLRLVAYYYRLFHCIGRLAEAGENGIRHTWRRRHP